MKPKILFISRNYPPKLGGLETYSYNLIKEFEKDYIVYKIVLSKSIQHLFWFLPYSLFKTLIFARRHNVEAIHLCDGLLAPLGVLLKNFTHTSVSISIHGLDITYNNFCYQSIIPRCVAKLENIICVSQSTQEECVQRGIPEQKCVVIPNGIQPAELPYDRPFKDLRIDLEKLLKIRLEEKKILLSIGRLIKRKGIVWFVNQVVPELDDTYLYVVAGEGPEFERIHDTVVALGLQNQVVMLGRVSDEHRRLIYNAADILVMPNITVKGDVEGFGIVAIEAGSCGLPVVASNVQGLKDAVIDNKTGYLIEERDSKEYVKRIRSMELNRADIRHFVNARFSWSEIYKQYRIALTC